MPTPAPNTPVYKNYSSLVLVKSKLSYGNRVVLVDTYQGTYADCLAGTLSRGTYGTVFRAGWVVTSSEAESGKGKSTLIINWEAGGEDATAPLPCDEFTLDVIELSPKVERNPYFKTTDKDIIRLAYNAVTGTTPKTQDTAYKTLQKASVNTDPFTSAQGHLGLTLVSMLSHGHETYYLAGWRYEWIHYSYSMPTLFKGGELSDPLGPLEGQFGDFEFLRLADKVAPAGVNGSCYKITATWLGGPSGHWEPLLYNDW